MMSFHVFEIMSKTIKTDPAKNKEPTCWEHSMQISKMYFTLVLKKENKFKK